MYDDFSKIQDEFEKICEEYGKISGRKYEVVEEYRLKDAKKVLVTIGSVSGTAKEAIDQLREKGEKVGLLEVSLFRPFPYEKIKKALKEPQEVVVMDRSMSFGTNHPLHSEITNSLCKVPNSKYKIESVVYGLGGRDTFQRQIMEVLEGKNKSNFLM
jgi:pyruvate ferredoxin oxidoreductase alpha subunit